jgi:hypothetical protein
MAIFLKSLLCTSPDLPVVLYEDSTANSSCFTATGSVTVNYNLSIIIVDLNQRACFSFRTPFPNTQRPFST